ncbi:MAG TPA: NAD(P)H dehydrogenase [Dysgonomonas sp.]|nr:NAD(P)H dehydrogenase [Dysgonomonas sp.]
MDIFIVYAHPSSKSFTYQIREALLTGLQKGRHNVEVSDLYKMDFHSDMTEHEYEQESFAQTDLPLSEDVVAEHQKMEWAGCIIFLYPLWWSDCPAKMKGWFDRVYSVGYAYGYNKEGQKVRKMKTIKYGIAICTAGHPNDFLEETGIAESMRKIMLEDRLGVRFENKKMMILGGTLDIEKVKNLHLNNVRALGEHIENYFEK